MEDLHGHEIDRSQRHYRSIEVGSIFCDWLTWAWSISICSTYFCCSGYIYQDRPVAYGIDQSLWKTTFWTSVFFGRFLIFFVIILVKNYILIFNNCFINFNFEFLIEIKDNIVILKIFRLIEHKVYEISLIWHSYHFFGLEK